MRIRNRTKKFSVAFSSFCRLSLIWGNSNYLFMSILENVLPCHVNERVNKNITLQQIFAKLNFANVNQIANEIINSNLLSKNIDIKYFWHLLQSHLLYSSNQNYFVPKLIALFLHFLIEKDLILRSRIIKSIFAEPNLKENFAIMIPFFYYFDYYFLI